MGTEQRLAALIALKGRVEQEIAEVSGVAEGFKGLLGGQKHKLK